MSLELVNAQHGARGRNKPTVPHLPPIALGPADDAREALFALRREAGWEQRRALCRRCRGPGGRTSHRAGDPQPARCQAGTAPAGASRRRPGGGIRPAAGARSHGADLPAAMFLLGVAASHIETLSDILRSVTGLPR